MAGTVQFTIGAEASRSDGTCGEVTRVISGSAAPRGSSGSSSPPRRPRFIPGTSGYAGYGPGQVGYWPYYGLGMGGGMSGGLSDIGGGNIAQTVTYDTVPRGEVDVRRGEHVQTTDGEIGRVQGLVIDCRSRQVTHVLLQEGHLWGRREVAIPISAVASTSDGIRLRLSKQEVRDVPPVDVDHPGTSGDGEGNG
jgi:hypothetical protein